MAYLALNRPQLQNLLNARFRGYSEDKKNRNMSFNAPNETLRNYLRQSDVVPPISSEFQRLRQEASILNYRGVRTKQALKQFIQTQRQPSTDLQARILPALQEVRTMPNLFNRDSLGGDDWFNASNRLLKTHAKLTNSEIESIVRKTTGGERFFLRIQFKNNKSSTYPINLQNENFLRSVLTNFFIEYQDFEVLYSDAILHLSYDAIKSMKLLKLNNLHGNGKHVHNSSGGFFRYVNSTTIDLTKYQIYRNTDESNSEACIIHTLQQAGIDETILNEIKLIIGAQNICIAKSVLNTIAEFLQRSIDVYSYDGTQIRKYTHKPNLNNAISIAFYKEHYFLHEEVNISKFSVTHRVKIDEYIKLNPSKESQRWTFNEKHRNGFRTKHFVGMNSLSLIVAIDQTNGFTDYVERPNYDDNYVAIPSLHNIENNQSEFKYADKKDKETVILYADCESDVNNEFHEIIAFGFMLFDKYYSIVTSDVKRITYYIYDAIKDICTGKKVIMYFHNLKYDMAVLNKFYTVDEVSKGGAIYSKMILINNIVVECRDSYKHFSGKLSSAPETFGLPAHLRKKEAMGYGFYTKDTIKNTNVSIAEYKEFVNPMDHPIFDETVIEYKTSETHFNARKYYLDYLELDCRVLQGFMIEYNRIIREITGLNADNYLTLSSIAHNFVASKGCYDGLYEVKGLLREWLQQAIKGGRVYVNPAYKCSEINEEIEDFDAVSLYPSSMVRLCKEAGLPMGTIKKAPSTWTINEYNMQSWYVVKIMIHRINKKQQIPCVSYKENGLLQYANECEDVEMYVSKFTLEDFIKFQHIEYTILEGVYWNEGFNTKLADVILGLHEERKKHKKSNVPMATMIKLLMNSVYGKTCQKKSIERIVYKSKNLAEDYFIKNFGVIKEMEELHGNVRFVEREFDSGCSLNYIGDAILSTSKRIMNEVFSVMNDNKMPVYYTDTDSIHMLKRDIEPLTHKFKDVFNRDLVGTELGQLHTDFDLHGAKNVFSIKHIPIQPKIYMDILQGEKNGEIVYDTHYRIKGVTSAGIKHKLSEYMLTGCNEIEATTQLFRDLKNGVPVEFTLNPTKFNASFDFNKNGVKSREVGTFKRIIKC